MLNRVFIPGRGANKGAAFPSSPTGSTYNTSMQEKKTDCGESPIPIEGWKGAGFLEMDTGAVAQQQHSYILYISHHRETALSVWPAVFKIATCLVCG